MGTQFGTRVCFSMRWSPLLACLQAKESISSFSACYWIDCFRTCSEEDSVQEQVQPYCLLVKNMIRFTFVDRFYSSISLDFLW